MNIKIGDKFLCIKDFFMNGGRKDYTKGHVYTCEKKDCLTDDGDCKEHVMNENYFFIGPTSYFEQLCELDSVKFDFQTVLTFKTYI